GAETTAPPYSVTCDTKQNRKTSSAVTIMLNNVSIDQTKPSVPTNVVANVVSSSRFNLSWTASTDNVVGYKIYRNLAQVATTTQTAYESTGLSASTTYTFSVSAYDAAGNESDLSGAVSARTPVIRGHSGVVAILKPTDGTVISSNVIAVTA